MEMNKLFLAEKILEGYEKLYKKDPNRFESVLSMILYIRKSEKDFLKEYKGSSFHPLESTADYLVKEGLLEKRTIVSEKRNDTPGPFTPRLKIERHVFRYKPNE